VNIFDLSAALQNLYPGVAIATMYSLPDKSDGEINPAKWPVELGAIPDQATLDAALVSSKRAGAIQRLRKEAVRRFEEGKRNDVLLARYSKKLRQAITRVVVLTDNATDPALLSLASDLDALESKWQGETLIEAEIVAAPDPDVYDDETIAASPHWGT